MSLGERIQPSPVHVRWEPVRIGLFTLFVVWAGRKLGRLLWTIARSPTLLITITIAAGFGVGWLQVGPWFDLAVLLMMMVVFGVSRRRWSAGFERNVALRWRAGWRRLLIYRHRWPASMDTAGLNGHRSGIEHLPVLGRVRSTRGMDRVRVRMLPGQTAADWGKIADRLAQTFGAIDCRVRSVPGKVHELELWFITGDPLGAPVEPSPAVAPAPWDGLPVGVREDGQLYRLQLRGTHVAVFGVTGSGKGSVLWSIITQLVPGVCDGTVWLWGLDPKGGMELAAGATIFDQFIVGDDDTTTRGFEEQFAPVLENAVTVMRHRQKMLRGVTRLHEPSTAEPLIVILIDELAALTGWVSDRTLKQRIGNALGLLLSQGRAVGVVVVAALQDPRKDVLPMRDLFPTRIALRLTEAEQVHLVLGPGARDRGAQCDLIPESLPGVGFVQVDGIAEPVRVRFAHVTDDHIRTAIHQSPLFTGLTDGGRAQRSRADQDGRAA